MVCVSILDKLPNVGSFCANPLIQNQRERRTSTVLRVFWRFMYEVILHRHKSPFRARTVKLNVNAEVDFGLLGSPSGKFHSITPVLQQDAVPAVRA